MNNPDHISESLETIFWVKILKFFYADPASGMEKIRIMDGKKWIRDKHPRFATLRVTGPDLRWQTVDVVAGKAEQMVVPTSYGILPVNMVRDERNVESEGEPLSSKHKENVEQKVQEIFGQNL